MTRKPAELSPNETLDALVDKINKKYKHRVIARGEDVPNVFFLRRPSGIMQLDIDTGGGMPAGGWCLISGPDGAGKTFLQYKYLAYHQYLYKQNSRLAMATTEFPPDHFFMRQCGIQVAVPDRAIEERNAWRVERGLPHFTKQEIRELKTQVGRIDVITGATGEETLGTVLEMFGTKLYGIIGVDSISAILPTADADKDLDENEKRAAAAGLQTKFSHHFHPMTLGLDNDVNETTLLMISQVRANNSKSEANPSVQKYLKDWAPTGSYAMRHGKLIDICIWPGAKVKVGTAEDRHQTGKILNWEIVKGKAGTHDGIRGEVEFDYKSQTDDAYTIFIAGVQNAVIVEGKAGWDVVRSDTKERMLQSYSRKGLIEKLNTDFEFQHRVRIEILAARGIQCRYH